MPLKSKKQMAFLFAKHPKIARRFAKKTPDPKGLPERADPKGSDDKGDEEEDDDMPRITVVVANLRKKGASPRGGGSSASPSKVGKPPWESR